MNETGALFLDEDGWRSLEIVNESGVEVDRARVIDHIRRSPEVAAISDWLLETHGHGGHRGRSRAGTMWERDRYVTPDGVFDQFMVASEAAEHDDIVSGVLESTEGLSFSKMTMEAEDEDEEDIWNQIAKNLDLDSRLREMWREMFTYSQVVVGMYWGPKTFTVRGTTKKDIKRKKKYSVNVPLGMTMINPLKVVPAGSLFFNKEKLLYLADRDEVETINQVLEGSSQDLLIRELLLEPYKLSKGEQKTLSDWGVVDRTSAERAYLMNPKNVFRHTETRPQYQPFATVRMKSVFELLDMKNQLRQKDRAELIGSTNFIVLIKKGSDALPATQKEVNALQGYARTLARVPMLVGDHRLSVEIVTPKQDQTLMPEKWNSIDARITARLYQMFMTGNFAAGTRGDDSIKLARVVARGLESRRHQLKRSLERHVWQPIIDANQDVFAGELPDLRFTPKRIALDFDINMANFMKELHDMGNLSRDTLLSEFDFDEDEEARKRKRAKESGLDDVFQTSVPFSSPQAQPFGNGQNQPPAQTPGAAGRSRGGNRNGGGAAPGTNQGKTKEQQAGEE